MIQVRRETLVRKDFGFCFIEFEDSRSEMKDLLQLEMHRPTTPLRSRQCVIDLFRIEGKAPLALVCRMRSEVEVSIAARAVLLWATV